MGISHDRGDILFQQKRFDLALREYRVELASHPNQAKTHAMIALCHVNLRQYPQARDAAEVAVSQDPGAALGHYALAWTFFADKAFSSRRPAELENTLAIGIRDHRLKLAAAAIAESLRLSPRDVPALALKSIVAFENMDLRAAFEAADAGLAIDPASGDCLRMRATIMRIQGDRQAAQAALSGVLAAEPDNAFSHRVAGAHALLAFDHQKALHHFVEVLRLDPMFPRGRMWLLMALCSRFAFYRLPLVNAMRLMTFLRRQGRFLRYLPLLVVIFIFLWPLFLLVILPARFETGFLILSLSIAPLFLALAIHTLAICLLIFDPLGRMLITNSQRLTAIALLLLCAFLSFFFLWLGLVPGAAIGDSYVPAAILAALIGLLIAARYRSGIS